MTDEFHQGDPAEPPAVTVAVLRERMAAMSRELRDMKDAQRRDTEEVRSSQRAHAEKLDAVLTVMSEARGGWRTLLLIGGASSSLGAAAGWLLSHFKG